jgi:hypothetical protein
MNRICCPACSPLLVKHAQNAIEEGVNRRDTAEIRQHELGLAGSGLRTYKNETVLAVLITLAGKEQVKTSIRFQIEQLRQLGDNFCG